MEFKTETMLAMYADGIPVTDIAEHFGWGTPSAVYRRFREFPNEYEKAKEQLNQRRIAKYRRVGALGVDISLKTLEHYQQILNSDADEEVKQKVRDKIKDISSVAETAERRADLNEDKPTDIIKNKIPELSPEEWKSMLKEAANAGTGLDKESISS